MSLEGSVVSVKQSTFMPSSFQLHRTSLLVISRKWTECMVTEVAKILLAPKLKKYLKTMKGSVICLRKIWTNFEVGMYKIKTLPAA